MENEKYWQLEVSLDEKRKELAIGGEPRWKDEKN